MAAGALAFVFQLFFFDRWANFMDEGHLLQFADMIAHGGELYRDATVYPLPGSFYLLAGLFKIFGPSILLSRWVVVIEFSLFVGLATALMMRIAPRVYVAAGVLALLLYRIWAFPHWHMYSYSTTALLVLLGSTLALLRFTDSERAAWLALSGLLFGLGVLCKQDYGAAALLASATLLAVHARSRLRPGHGFWMLLVLFLAPASAVGAATGLYFYERGLLADLLRFTVFNHFVGMSEYTYRAFPPLLPLFEQDPTLRSPVGVWAFLPAIWMTVDRASVMSGLLYEQTAVFDCLLKVFYFGPLLAIPVALAAAWRRRALLNDPRMRQRAIAELALLFLAAAFMALVWLNKPQDYLHLAVMYWPLACLLPAALYRCRRTRPAGFRAGLVIAAVPALLFVLYSGRLVWLLRSLHSEPLPAARAGVSVTPGQARSIGDLVAYIQEQTAPGEVVGVFPYAPLLHFLAERPGPHRTSYILWPFAELADRDRQVIDAMERHGTRLVVMDFIDIQDFPPLRQYAPELFSYLVENFTLDRVFSDDELLPRKLAVFRRESEAKDGVVLHPMEISGTTLTTESTGLPPRPIPPEQWDDYVAEESWPLRPVLALRPSLRDTRTVLRVPVVVPEASLLRTAIGVNPVNWDGFPGTWVRFELSVNAADVHERVFERRLDPNRSPGDRGWFDVEVDLSRWAGQRVILEFATECELERGQTKLMAAWAAPRLLGTGATAAVAH